MGPIKNLWIWCAVAVAVSGLWTLEHLYFMNQDGLTYLDMATEAVRHGPAALINGMWNPLYPAVIAVLLSLLKPSPAMDVAVMQLANWLLFAATAVSFTLFLGSWMGLKSWREGGPDSPSPALFALAGLSMFTWLYMRMDMTWATTPDLLISACVFLAGWCLMRATERPHAWAPWWLLGGILGVAYYSKPVGLHIAVLLFAYLLFTWREAAARKRLAAGVFCFCVLAGPLIGALSARTGHLTISESGKLNYIWHTNGFYTFMGWTGQDRAAHGTPVHAPRVLSDHPLMLEFASPVKGTYPLWFDPSYWYDGVRVQYGVKRQIVMIAASLLYYYRVSTELLPLWAGAIALGILAYRRRGRPWLLGRLSWAIGWPVLVAAMLTLVNSEARYLAPFMMLLAIAVYTALARAAGAAANPVLLTLSVLLILSIGAVSGFSASRFVKRVAAHYRSDDQEVASRLEALGLEPGDAIATVGYSFDAYYAHFAALHIVAQAPDQEEFQRMSQDGFHELTSRLRAFDVKAIIAPDGRTGPEKGWTELPPREGAGLRAYLLK